MSTAVVTVVAGRHDHLRAQRAHLSGSCPAAGRHVLVAVDDPQVEGVAAGQRVATRVVACPTTPGGLPTARARNAGAEAALADPDVETLVFLDVDCIPAPDLLARLGRALAERPEALVCGSVTYLPPAPAGGWDAAGLRSARSPHPARPDPPDGELADLAPGLFWSLCFAVTADAWRRLGGFYPGYVGYGAEDTDLGVRAAAAGVPILLAGGADAFHQHHPVDDPPVQHLDDILRNSAVFARRHGWAPMAGWHAAFEQRGLTVPGTLRRTDAVRVAAIPPRHAYVDAVTPPTVVPVDPDRVRGWEPDPLFEPARLRAAAADLDVVHLHFGYDRFGADELRAWLDTLRACGIPLVLTVHDLRNPHHDAPERHDGHLRQLVAAAAEVLTLTAAAADELARRYGRRPVLAPHPTVLDKVPGEMPGEVPGPTADAAPDPPRAPGHVLVPLKALRRNVRDPMAVVRAARRGADRAGHRVRVLVEPDVLDDPSLAGLDRAGVDLDVAPYLPHEQVVARVADAAVCVLPYRFGTHSGWVELCRDLGTRVVAPDCGHYAQQWDEVLTYVHNERVGLDEVSLADTVAAACTLPGPARADRTAREAERDQVQALHDALYRRVARR